MQDPATTIDEVTDEVPVDLPWYLALTIAERGQFGTPTEVDRARGEKRLAMWMELTPFSGDRDTLDERLTALGVSAEDLVCLLGETATSLAGRCRTEPLWHRMFVRWWRQGSAVADDDRMVGPRLELLEVARPLLESAVRELDAAVRSRLLPVAGADPILSDMDHLVTRVLSTLPMSEVLGNMQRTMALELNVARLEGELVGDTPEVRFASYVDRLTDRDTSLAVWREYPVLARMIVNQLRLWIDACVELLDALIDDARQLRERGLLPAEATRLEQIEFGAGDKHNGGRSVVMLTFDTGRLVFKPRPLTMDIAFDGLLAWLNDQGLTHRLRRSRVWDRGGYGWSGYIDTAVTTDADGADRYAWRLGALTAVLYALHATDFHYENVLATGEDPVLVDLEALLHTDKSSAVMKVGGEANIGIEALVESVQSVGVIPNKFLMRDDEGTFGLDVSALGGQGGQLTPMAVPTFEATGTDTMHLVNRHMEMDAKRNHPVDADDRPLDLLGRVEEFVAGFNAGYRCLWREREQLLAPDGALAAFARTRSRLVARPTHVYGRLLMEASHPDFLRDGLDWDRSLARMCGGHEDMDCRDAMVRGEMAEMSRGDVPVFTMDADTGLIRSGAFGEPVGDRRPTPFDVVTDRVRDLSEADRAFQESVIRASVAATTMGDADAGWPNWQRARETSPVTDLEAGTEAARIAARLADLAIQDGTRVGWIGLNLVEERFWQLSATDIDTYVGTSGIGHALDAVSAVTGDPRAASLAGTVFDRLADRAVWLARELPQAEEKARLVSPGIGAFSGMGGTIYTLAHAAARHGRPDLAEAALAMLSGIAPFIDEDTLLDVVSGVAGTILVLLALERVAPGRGALDTAHRCAARLLATARATDDGCGWMTPICADEPLLGFSHGASGVAVALARLHAVDPRPEYAEAVRQAIRYEAAHYDEATGNWPDLRPASMGGKANMNAWCHGAPGVLLARHELLRLGTVPDMAGQLELDRQRAVRATMSTGLALQPVTGIGNHSLCHGDVGNLLILQKAHRAQTEPDVAELLPVVWRTLIAEGRSNRWLCGVPLGIETPGLMTGIAGIAWGLARLAAPDGVPDVLALEPPVANPPASTDAAGRPS